MMKKVLAITLVTACMMTSLAGCGGRAGSADATSIAKTGENKTVETSVAAEKKDSVTVACAAEPDTFIAWYSKASTSMDEVPILHNVYESLIKLGPDNSHEPLLATEWSVSDDGCTYTLKIRDDVYFHNGLGCQKTH